MMPATAVAADAADEGEEVCVTASVDGATGEACAQRRGFGAEWTVDLTDTADDGRPVKATVSLEVVEATDQTASVDNGDGAGSTTRAGGTFRPRIGAALGDVTIETCVDIRFLPDRCDSASAALPQLDAQGTPAQLERLEELVFELPLERFLEVRTTRGHADVDESFDWSSDGCSAGPFRELLGSLDAACLRHDFAYRNYGQLSLDPRDEVRGAVDEQLAADATAVGQGRLAPGLRDSLRRFAAPVFFGDDLASLWGVPDFIAQRLRTEQD
jgi:hypothetical protein